MLDQNKQELDNLMNFYQNDLAGIETRRKQEKSENVEFKKAFDKMKHEIIWPTIVEVGNELTQYKHDFHISEEEEYIDATAAYHPASITFNIYPATMATEFKKPDSAPYISFIANSYGKKVGIMVSTMLPGEGGTVGSHGEFDLIQITGELVENEIMSVLKNTLMFRPIN